MAYFLVNGEYSEQFLIALAMAIHCKVTNPSEVKFMLDNNWDQLTITKELYKRVKESRPS